MLEGQARRLSPDWGSGNASSRMDPQAGQGPQCRLPSTPAGGILGAEAPFTSPLWQRRWSWKKGRHGGAGTDTTG